MGREANRRHGNLTSSQASETFRGDPWVWMMLLTQRHEVTMFWQTANGLLGELLKKLAMDRQSGILHTAQAKGHIIIRRRGARDLTHVFPIGSSYYDLRLRSPNNQ